MQSLQDGYRGLAFLVNLNADRILFPLAIGAALTAGAYFCTWAPF